MIHHALHMDWEQYPHQQIRLVFKGRLGEQDANQREAPPSFQDQMDKTKGTPGSLSYEPKHAAIGADAWAETTILSVSCCLAQGKIIGHIQSYILLASVHASTYHRQTAATGVYWAGQIQYHQRYNSRLHSLLLPAAYFSCMALHKTNLDWRESDVCPAPLLHPAALATGQTQT
jgi:hypothetical protein